MIYAETSFKDMNSRYGKLSVIEYVQQHGQQIISDKSEFTIIGLKQ